LASVKYNKCKSGVIALLSVDFVSPRGGVKSLYTEVADGRTAIRSSNEKDKE
ncbi:Uncharacterized protein DAT39_016878, partial [Clarias magur]